MSPQDFIAHFHPQAFYHFTDLRNLDSIRQYGLLAVSELHSRGVVVPHPGGNAWSREADQIKGLDGYVHLCFVSNHPMQYIAQREGHIGDTRYLQIKPSIILTAGTMGCNSVANKRGAVVRPICEALDEIDLEILFVTAVNFSNQDQRNRYNEAKKAEILIPTQIAVQHILNL